MFIYFDNKRWDDKQRTSKQLYVFVKSVVFVDGAAPGPLSICLVVFLERFIEKFGLKKRSIWEIFWNYGTKYLYERIINVYKIWKIDQNFLDSIYLIVIMKT